MGLLPCPPSTRPVLSGAVRVNPDTSPLPSRANGPGASRTPPPWRCSPSAPATKRPRPLLHTHTHTVCAPHENGTRNAHAVITPTAQTSTPPPSTSSTSFASFTQKKSNSYYTFSLRTQRAPISLSHAQVCDASQSLRLRSSSRENTLRLYMPLSSYTILSDTMAIYA